MIIANYSDFDRKYFRNFVLSEPTDLRLNIRDFKFTLDCFLKHKCFQYSWYIFNCALLKVQKCVHIGKASEQGVCKYFSFFCQRQ